MGGRRRPPHKGQWGFTFFELLLGVTLLVVIGVVFLTALNPGRQLAQARNGQRRSAVSSLAVALKQYAAQNTGQLPAGVDTTLRILRDEHERLRRKLRRGHRAALRGPNRGECGHYPR